MKGVQDMDDDLDLSIRVGEDRDLEFLVELALSIRNLEAGHGRVGWVEDYRTFVRYILIWMKEVLHDTRFVVLVAERDGAPVAGTVAEVQGLELFFDPPVQGNVLMFAVLDEERRKRIGVRLMGALEAVLYEAGVRRVVCDCYQANTPVQWGLLKIGYRYEYVRMARDMDGSMGEGIVSDTQTPQEDT